MRNLKRVLSLTLASVMLLSLMVVGAGAVGYSDVDYNSDNVEAIEVMTALGIFEGDEGTSNFRPHSAVTRAEMAKIMATLLGLNYKYYEGSHPYTDMVGHWAEAYAAACAANGIINGRGNGVYDPGATVTAIEASAMLMRAMGYFKYANDVAEGFEVATISQANKIGLYIGIEGSAYEGMPRNDVAQLVLNALKCSMVDVQSMGTTITTADGTVINTGNTVYQTRYVTSTANSKYTKINASARNTGGTGTGEYSVELGEELYDGKLELKDDIPDPFGRKSTQWWYNNKVIGTYSNEPDLVYTKKITGKDVWNDLGRPDTRNTKVYYTIDGDTRADVGASDGRLADDYKPASGSDKDIPFTERGVRTEVYYDAANDRIDYIIINTYLAKVLSDYNESDDSLSISVLSEGYSKDDGYTLSFEAELDGADFGIIGYKQDDYVMVTATYVKGGDCEIQSVSPATKVTGTISSYKHGSNLVMEGKTYNYSYQVQWDSKVLGNDYLNSKGISAPKTPFSFRDAEYNLYLDPYGNIMGIEKVTGSDNLSDYLFVVKSDNDALSAAAEVVFLGDGTSKVVTVAKTAKKDGTMTKITDPKKTGRDANGGDIEDGELAAGRFYTFSVNKNGEYELTSVGDNAYQGWVGATYYIKPDADDILHPIMKADAEGGSWAPPVNNKTVFVAGEKLYVGVENTPKVSYKSTSTDAIYYLIAWDTVNVVPSYLKAVYTARGGAATTSADEWYYIYDRNTQGKDEDGTTYYMYSAVSGKDKLTLDSVTNVTVSGNIPGLYKVESYSDGYAELGGTAKSSYYLAKDSDASDLVYSYRVASDAYIVYADGVLTIWDDETHASGVYYYVNSDAQVYLLYGNENSKSIGAVSSIGAAGLKGLPKASDGYDVYLIMDKEGSMRVALAYFVRRNK